MLEMLAVITGFIESLFKFFVGSMGAFSQFLFLISTAINIPIVLAQILPDFLAFPIVAFMAAWIIKGIFGR